MMRPSLDQGLTEAKADPAAPVLPEKTRAGKEKLQKV